MKNYYITFQHKYFHEIHPVYPDSELPYKYLRIVAPSMEEANKVALSKLGNHWCYLYSDSSMRKHLFPKGEIEVLYME